MKGETVVGVVFAVWGAVTVLSGLWVPSAVLFVIVAALRGLWEAGRPPDASASRWVPSEEWLEEHGHRDG